MEEYESTVQITTRSFALVHIYESEATVPTTDAFVTGFSIHGGQNWTHVEIGWRLTTSCFFHLLHKYICKYIIRLIRFSNELLVVFKYIVDVL